MTEERSLSIIKLSPDEGEYDESSGNFWQENKTSRYYTFGKFSRSWNGHEKIGEGEGHARVSAALFWRQFEGVTALPARLLQLIHQYLISIDNSFPK